MLSPPPFPTASLGLLISTAPQIIAMAITNAVGQLIIGTTINVAGASLSDLPVYKKGSGVDGAIGGADGSQQGCNSYNPKHAVPALDVLGLPHHEKRLSELFAYRTKRQSQVRRDLNEEQEPHKFAKLEWED
ncbi:hypothetical protein N9F34_04080 [Alphaproteobacteria bacterium]|nr:hypothetical protein [Alphaproteobacteria bacterium]